MAIIDDYAGIAAELRGIKAERETARRGLSREQTVGAYVTTRGTIEVNICVGTPARRLPVFTRRAWSTD